MAGQSSAWKGK